MFHPFKTIRVLLASVLAIVSTIPHSIIHGSITRREPPSLSVDQRGFFIKTRVHTGEDRSKDGLYIDTYHIGPGQNAVVLNKEPRLEACLNGTNLRFQSTSDEFGLDMNEHYTYDGWVPVLINPFNLQAKFFIRNDTLVWLSPQYQGWLVCDWALEEPQLFRFNERYNLYGGGYPSTCAQVDLVLEDT